jgi:hypothetical protein
LLIKLPVPVPSVVLESLIVGAVTVDQQMPFAVTSALPSAVMFPPETAVVRAIEETSAVVRVGTIIGVVVNDTSFP